MRCPVCQTETQEKKCSNCGIILDDEANISIIRCPKCDAKIEKMSRQCPYCGTMLKEGHIHSERNFTDNNTEERTNADCLNFMANLNIILICISALFVLIKFSFIEISTGKYSTETEFSWIGIIGAISILITGFTLFFLLKTVADIYWEVER